jgi:O-antigen/teichoic acid export membrane protein
LELLLAGSALHVLVYSYFRGRLAMKQANVLQFLNLGLVPVLTLYFFRKSAADVLTGLGSFTFSISAFSLLFTPWLSFSAQTLSEARELLRYGVQRFPGDFVLTAMMTIPVTLVAHFRGIQEAGMATFAISVLGMIGSFFAPVSLVLLPKASRLLADGNTNALCAQIKIITKLTALASVGLTVVILAVSGILVRLYLGENFSQAGDFIRIAVLGAVPYSMYVVLRSLIDAFHRNAIITLILIKSFVVFVVAAVVAYRVFGNTAAILVALMVGLTTLSGLTWLETKRILGKPPTQVQK